MFVNENNEQSLHFYKHTYSMNIQLIIDLLNFLFFSAYIIWPQMQAIAHRCFKSYSSKFVFVPPKLI